MRGKVHSHIFSQTSHFLSQCFFSAILIHNLSSVKSEENEPHLFCIVLPLLPQIFQLPFHYEMHVLIFFRRTVDQATFAICYTHIKLEKIIYLVE